MEGISKVRIKIATTRYQVPGLVDANQFCDVSEAFDAVRDRPVTVGIGCYHPNHSRVLVNVVDYVNIGGDSWVSLKIIVGRRETWGCILLLERERGLRTKKFWEGFGKGGLCGCFTGSYGCINS